MIIKGIQKMSMVDYPGLLCTTLFTPGCNLRCPFCQNGSLVTGAHSDSGTFIDLDDLFAFLSERKRKIDAVCLSGGEPLLQSDAAEFLLEIKKMGFKTKLDTNGTRPEALFKVLSLKAADYVAMDVKNCAERYGGTVGIGHFDLSPILQSIKLLSESETEHEFRTTVTSTFHDLESLKGTGELIRGAKHWYLQAYKESEGVIDKTTRGYDEKTLKSFLPALEGYAETVLLRGF
jgi:pyruvate formate lyase activating enzyme